MTRPNSFRGFAALLWLIALAVVSSCATNPVTGHKELSLVSGSQELAIGREGYPAVVGEYGLYDDPAMAAYVDSVGQALGKVSHLPTLAWHFTVIDDPVVNAFAMPGGYIYVTRGILAHLNSEAQLAGVLGHEIGHVTARHTAQQITKQQLAGIGLALGTVLSETFARYGQEAQQALGLLMLKYSRDDETQADQLGVTYSTAAGWDAREMPATYRMLGRMADLGGQRLPSFLSTHPDPGDREQRTTALSAQAAAGKTNLQIRQRAYIQRQNGEVFGNDPREGFVDGGHYYHPQLKLEFALPANWNHQDTRQAFAFAEPAGKAQMVVTVADSKTDSPAEVVQQLRAAGNLSDAAGASETIGGWPAWVGRVAVPVEGAAPRVLTAAWVRYAPGQMLRFVGQTAAPGDANDAQMLATVRSLRPLTDAGRLGARPARIKVVSVTKASTLAQLIEAQGASGAKPDEIAILNDLQLDDMVQPGQLVKLVTPARLR